MHTYNNYFPEIFTNRTELQMSHQSIKKAVVIKQATIDRTDLTNQICKLFEAIVQDSVADHLENDQLINDTQHEFRSLALQIC